MSRIPLAKPYFDNKEINEIEKVLKSGWVSQGPKVKEFEDKIANYLGVKYAVAVTNCTSALHLALLAIGISTGDEVLVSDFTFPATGHSVLYCGANPIFIDVDISTYNILPELIEEKITEKTKAIIPVHTFGQPAEMEKIIKIARAYGLKVIEDAACAIGAKYKTNFAGTIGDVGCISFHARKGITCGEGGMVITEDDDLAKKIRALSIFGISNAWSREQSNNFIIPEFLEMGYNYKMSDITAAVGIAQLDKINKIVNRKRDLARYWDEKVSELEYMVPPQVSNNVFHVYQSYVALVDRSINRNKLINDLLKKGIQTQIGTYASHIQPVYKSREKCPMSLELFNRSLALPMYYDLTYEEIDVVIRAVRSLVRG